MKAFYLLLPITVALLATGCKKKVVQKPALTVTVYSIHSSNSSDSDYVATTNSFRVVCDSLGFEEEETISGNGTFYFERMRPGGYTIRDAFNQKKLVVVGPESDERITLTAP